MDPDPLAVANDQQDNRMTDRPSRTATGVILGTSYPLTQEVADALFVELRHRFPGVQFAVVPGAHSVAFTYQAHDARVD